VLVSIGVSALGAYHRLQDVDFAISSHPWINAIVSWLASAVERWWFWTSLPGVVFARSVWFERARNDGRYARSGRLHDVNSQLAVANRSVCDLATISIIDNPAAGLRDRIQQYNSQWDGVLNFVNDASHGWSRNDLIPRWPRMMTDLVMLEGNLAEHVRSTYNLSWEIIVPPGRVGAPRANIGDLGTRSCPFTRGNQGRRYIVSGNHAAFFRLV
jgi:hypothetical protein